MATVQMIIGGGFLGAGKTTLLAAAAALLAQRGKRVGLLTNDQAPGLVDTALLKQQGFEVGEVAGGCFCCRFDQFVQAADRLVSDNWPEVLIAEPVGSCTDLAATVIQPLQDLYAGRFRVSPYTVLVEPQRLREALAGEAASAFDPKVQYIYAKQLEEAELIAINKSDLLKEAEVQSLKKKTGARFPQARVASFSALNGEGVEQWLELMLSQSSAGGHSAEVDYDTYAEGEAALGWLNATIRLEGPEGTSWRDFTGKLLTRLQAELKTRRAEVAHLKVFLSARGVAIFGNLTSTAGAPVLRERGVCGKDTTSAWLTLNARAAMEPAELKAAVEQSLRVLATGGRRAEITMLEHFKPGRPQPVHRYTQPKA